MTDSAFILILILANIAQFIFWSIQNQKLVNKLMSRNYHEYEQVTKPQDPRGFKVQIPTDEELSMPNQTRIMDELISRTI